MERGRVEETETSTHNAWVMSYTHDELPVWPILLTFRLVYLGLGTKQENEVHSRGRERERESNSFLSQASKELDSLELSMCKKSGDI